MLFTGHNVPVEHVLEGDPYVEQLQQTVAQLVGLIMPGDWRFAFQSKGRSGGEWLEPEVDDVVRELADDGWKKLLVVPVGFVTDHVETLYDLDIVLREQVEANGMELPPLAAAQRLAALHRGARRHRDRVSRPAAGGAPAPPAGRAARTRVSG